MNQNPFIKLTKQSTTHPLDNKAPWIHARRVKTYHNSVYNVQYPPQKVKKYDKPRVTFTVIGNRVTKQFLECCEWVTVLHKYRSKSFAPPIIRGLSQLEWLEAWKDLKLRYGANVFCIRSKVAVLMNNAFLGDNEDLKKLVMTKYAYHISLNYHKRGMEVFMEFVKNSGRPFTYMHIMIDGDIVGSFIFMLYMDVLPLTCANFLRLCRNRRGGYGGTPVHRIVKDGWIQCGGYGLKQVDMPCENYAVPHDRRGVLSMANNGRHCHNSTQFFITLQPTPWMNQKYVAFGQLIDGDETLKKIEHVPTRYESPKSKIIICRARELEIEPKKLDPCPNRREYLNKHLLELNEFIDNQMNEIIELVNMKLDDKHYIQQLLEDYFTFLTADELYEEEIAEESTRRSHLSLTDKSLTTSDESIQRTKSSVIIPKVPVLPRILIIPFGDIEYPGACDSDCDLTRIQKKCMQVDNQILKRVPPTPTTSKVSAGGYMAEIMSPSEDEDVNSDNFIEIQEYLRLNADRVSFTGSIIRSIARSMAQTNVLTSIRSEREVLKTVTQGSSMHAVSLSERYPDRSRKTTTFQPVQLGSRESDTSAAVEPGFIGSDEQVHAADINSRRVRIASKKVHRSVSQQRRNTRGGSQLSSSPGSVVDDRRQSVLARLLNRASRSSDSDQDPPTLKDYYKRLSSLTTPKNFFLTTSALRRSDLATAQKTDKLLREPSWPLKQPIDTTDKILSLRHGPKLKRRYSSDYIHSRFMIEKGLQKKKSIREAEFARIRPSISVEEYRRISKEKEVKQVIEKKEEPIMDVCKRAYEQPRRDYSWMSMYDDEDADRRSRSTLHDAAEIDEHLWRMDLEEDYYELDVLEESSAGADEASRLMETAHSKTDVLEEASAVADEASRLMETAHSETSNSDEDKSYEEEEKEGED